MSFRLATIAVALGLATTALLNQGCGASSAEAPVQTAQAASTKAAFTVPAHGFVKVALDALGDVALRPEQRAQIETLAKDAETRHEATRQAREALMLAIADQVQAGNVDQAALQPKLDTMKAAMDASKPRDAAGLEKLHGILDADQRAAFVNGLKAKALDHGGGDDDDHASGAAAPPGAQAHAGPGGHGGGMGFGPLGHLAAELKLTDDQKDKMKQAFFAQRSEGGPGGASGPGGAMMHDGRGGHERIEKTLDAFKSDHFVVAELEGDHAGKDFMTEHGDRLFKLAQTMLPILTSEQRTTLAAKIRDQAVNGDEH
ncbi:hypothetical protein BH09MYX1_BH09MYX1_32450 [soil metagenome]